MFITIAITLVVLGIMYAVIKLIGKKLPAVSLGAISSGKLVTIALVTVALVFINRLCYDIGWQWWHMLWDNHKTLFWTTNASLLYAFTVLVITQNTYARNAGKIILGICILGILTVNNVGFTTSSAAPAEIKVPQKQLIKVGSVGTFFVSQIESIDNIDYEYRYDNEVNWIERKKDMPWPQYPRWVNKMHVRSNQDIVVTLR